MVRLLFNLGKLVGIHGTRQFRKVEKKGSKEIKISSEPVVLASSGNPSSYSTPEG
jgi:hypothetical protein